MLNKHIYDYLCVILYNDISGKIILKNKRLLTAFIPLAYEWEDQHLYQALLLLVWHNSHQFEWSEVS